jgi:DNA repair exonuclease SbcCD ATPase subunit
MTVLSTRRLALAKTAVAPVADTHVKFDITSWSPAEQDVIRESIAYLLALKKRMERDVIDMGDGLKQLRGVLKGQFESCCQEVLDINPRAARRMISLSEIMIENGIPDHSEIRTVRKGLLNTLVDTTPEQREMLKEAASKPKAELEAMLESFREENQRAKEAELAAKATAANAQRELQSLQSELDRMRAKSAEAEAELLRLTQQFQDKVADYNTAQEELTAVRRDLRALKDAPPSTLEVIPEGYKTVEAAIAAKEKELATLVDKTKRAKQELHDAEEKFEAAKANIEASKDIDQVIASIEQDVAALMEKYTKALIATYATGSSALKSRFKNIGQSLKTVADQIIAGAA